MLVPARLALGWLGEGGGCLHAVIFPPTHHWAASGLQRNTMTTFLLKRHLISARPGGQEQSCGNLCVISSGWFLRNTVVCNYFVSHWILWLVSFCNKMIVLPFRSEKLNELPAIVICYNPKSEIVGMVWRMQIKKESSDF